MGNVRYFDVFQRVDAKIALNSRVTASSNCVALVAAGGGNPCHQPGGNSEGGRFAPKDVCGIGDGVAPAPSPHVSGPPVVNGIEEIGGVALPGWRGDHGISAKSMDTIGFRHWEKTSDTEDGSMDPAINDAYGTDSSAMAQMRNAARQSSGVIMTRNAIPGSPFEVKPILPQTRPDNPVIPSGQLTELRKSGIDLGDLDADPELDKRVRKGYVAEADFTYKDKTTGKMVEVKKGEEITGVGAKYLFPAGEGNAARVDLPPDPGNTRNFLEGKGTVYVAMEGSLKTAAVLSALDSSGELGKEGGASVIGIPSVTLWHRSNPSKIRAAIAAAKDPAKKAQLEAYLKVVQEHGSEMEWAIKEHLKGRTVVLIPDADGLSNPNVSNQTRALQNLMETSGAKKVLVAAAPVPLDAAGAPRLVKDEINGKAHVVLFTAKASSGKTEELKGVDDYLGAGQGDLGSLAVADRVPANVSFKGAKVNSAGLGEEPKLVKLRTDARLSAEDTLRAASLLAHPETGEFRVGARTLAGAIGGDHKVVEDALSRLVTMGVLQKENLSDMTPERKSELIGRGVMAVAPRSPSWHWGGKRATVDNSGRTKVAGTDAEDIVFDENSVESPVYTIVNPAHRAVAKPFETLASALDDKPGRQIRTPAGAAWYGQSVGSDIVSADDNPDEQNFASSVVEFVHRDWAKWAPTLVRL